MRRSVFVTVFLLCFMTGQAFAADNLSEAVSKIESGILTILKGVEGTVSQAARETGILGLNRETEIRKLLQNCNTGRPYVIDSTFVDGNGIMKFIEPEKYRKYEGTDISKQEAIIEMRKTQKPRMGSVFVSAEGVKSIDIEYPIFSAGKKFIGSISILVRHDELIRSVASTVENESVAKCWVMQKDGLLLYETDPMQMGLNLFTDPLYKDYPELIKLGKQMVKEKEGKGFYTFLIHGTKTVVKKQAVWKTVHFLNNDWIVVAYKEVK
ncbi:MAG TPA: hypothetical protein DD636_09605 [Anaerolineaceae bacterium]|nr:hypothetical protein [Anaerolineaceae bacterium]